MWTLTNGYCIRCLCVTRSAPPSPAYKGRDSTTTHIFLCYANLVVTSYLSRTRTKLRQRWKPEPRSGCNFVGKRSGERRSGASNDVALAPEGRSGRRVLAHLCTSCKGGGRPHGGCPNGVRASTRREGGPKDHGRGALYNRVRFFDRCVSPECTLVCKYLGGGRKEPRRRSPPTIVSGKSEDHGAERATVAGRGTCLR